MTLRKDYCTLAPLDTEKDTKGHSFPTIYLLTVQIVSYYIIHAYKVQEITTINHTVYIFTKSKSNYYHTSQRHAAFIEILADSVWAWHQGNLTIFGQVILTLALSQTHVLTVLIFLWQMMYRSEVFMTGTCPEMSQCT